MNLRSKIAGIVAGTTLTLASIAGVTAQTDPTADTKIILEPNATGACFASVGTTNNIDFGSFAWDGESEEYEGTFTGTLVISASQTRTPAGITCNFTIVGTDLTQREGQENTEVTDGDLVLAKDIQLTSGLDANPGALSVENTFAVDEVTGRASKDHSIGWNIGEAIDAQADGTYIGTLTITDATNGLN